MKSLDVYLVGGAVRDALLGRESDDRDYVVVGSTPDEMVSLGFKKVGSSFPVFLHPVTGDEYALARMEKKSGNGHTGFEFNAAPDVTIEEDLARRDLTINAMAIKSDGSIIDPFGGQDDLKMGILRHVGPAFGEDPLRVFRVARFVATLGFFVAPKTIDLMRSFGNELYSISSERVAAEMIKALSGRYPERFFWTLDEAGSLKQFFFEVWALKRTPAGPEKYHGKYSSFSHTMMVLAHMSRLSSDPLYRFGALVHDLGKGVTPETEWPHHYDHHETGPALVTRLCSGLALPNAYKKAGKVAAKFHRKVRMARTMKPGKVVNLLTELGALHSPAMMELVLTVSEADELSHVTSIAFGRDTERSRPFLQDALAAMKRVDVGEIREKYNDDSKFLDVLKNRRAEAVRSVWSL